nr:hypothetical protein [Chroococcidiopsis sp. SAG 2025]
MTAILAVATARIAWCRRAGAIITRQADCHLIPMRSPKPLSFSLPMTAALSTALSYSSMVAWHKSK